MLKNIFLTFFFLSLLICDNNFNTEVFNKYSAQNIGHQNSVYSISLIKYTSEPISYHFSWLPTSNCIINTKALIEHNVKVEKNCHISTGAILNGGVEVKKNTFIGSGSIIKEGVKIGENCIIGAGSVIKKNLPRNSKVL